ncbi:MAG: peptidoglycan DD-metalloendopeptidase family protein [Hyphomonadaceae bacterium]
MPGTKQRTPRVLSGLVLAASALALSACDVGEVALWPWVEPSEEQPDDTATVPPPPPTEPVDPLDPADANPVIENPDANLGAPEDGTPFPEGPETPIPVSSDESTPVSAETGEPVDTSGPADGDTPTDASTPSDGAAPDADTDGPTVPAVTPAFFYYPPGDLEPDTGTGSPDTTVFSPDMVFPIRTAPAHPQSQVYRYGGGAVGGSQCDARNFTAPWRDNFCEKRTSNYNTTFCPSGKVHLGQDIRVGDREGCLAEVAAKPADRTRYEIVAVEDGTISNVGSYSVTLRAGGRIYRYLHPNMAKLKVATGQAVKKGDVIGYVSNDFGGSATTLHLHFEIKVNTAEAGWQYAPPYTSLLAAYQRREDNPGEMVTDTPTDPEVGVSSN